MSFESLQMTARGATIKDRVSIQAKGVVFRLADETLAKLGWENGDFIDVQVGRGADHGRVRLAKGEHGRILHPAGQQGHRGLVVKIGRTKLGGGPSLPEMPNRLESTPIIVGVVNGCAEFMLPWIYCFPNTKQPVAQRDPERPFAIDNLPLRANGKALARPASRVPREANS